MREQMPSSYTLSQIAEWGEKESVSLPTVQRGFVWKPHQIENLWDSLLRGYPVGAFVLSPKNDGKSFEILDGQQRATAICLGFDKETFRETDKQVKVFIDLILPEDDSRKYVFRVITRSHPWGYRKVDNTKTLTSDNIRKAMEQFAVEDHLKADLSIFYPFDAELPIPFQIFMEAAASEQSVDELIKKIKSWEYWEIINARWEQRKPNLDKSNQEKEDLISKSIAKIYEEVKVMLSENKGQKIPALYLDLDRFKSPSENVLEIAVTMESTEGENSEEKESEKDEIENLFIRLNAGGTPLSGEELNYSILKSHIHGDLQKEIEKNCIGFARPSRFITIAYRLYLHHKKANENQKEAISLRIKPKQFQSWISTKSAKDGFSEFIHTLLVEKKPFPNCISPDIVESKTLLEYVHGILEYHKDHSTYGLPYLLTSRIADTAPELMFLLLYRIYIKGDTFQFGTDTHKRMLGMMTLFQWLGKGGSRRDHSRLLSNIWNAATKMDKDRFWSSESVELAFTDDILIRFPKLESIEDIINYKVNVNTNVREEFHQKNKLGFFIDKMFYNRDLVVYAQRYFLESYFNRVDFLLDDTNMPFDWDHISPYSYIHRRWNIPAIIGKWYGSIGNFRAWPYTLNRMNQADEPAKKLNPLNSDNLNEHAKQFWITFVANHNNIEVV